MFFGENILALLMLALGGAMAAGNAAALLRPRTGRRDPDDLERAPVARCLLYMIVGLVAAVWALASLLSS